MNCLTLFISLSLIKTNVVLITYVPCYSNDNNTPYSATDWGVKGKKKKKKDATVDRSLMSKYKNAVEKSTWGSCTWHSTGLLPKCSDIGCWCCWSAERWRGSHSPGCGRCTRSCAGPTAAAGGSWRSVWWVSPLQQGCRFGLKAESEDSPVGGGKKWKLCFSQKISLN